MIDEDVDMDPIDPDYNHFNNITVNFTSHSIDTFKRNSNLDSKSLNILHHNSRSIMRKGKMAEYDAFLKAIDNPFGILIFTETWLTDNKKGSCKFKGYTPIHLIRPNDQHFDFKERGGGISIFVRDDIEFTRRNDLDVTLPFIECCFIETLFNNKKYIIVGMYRTPNTNINLFIEKFNEVIEPLKASYEIIVLGDFNINLFNDDNNKNMFEYCLQSNYLIPTILGATRLAIKKQQDGQLVTTETLIDNVILKANMNHYSGLIDTHISDHFPIYTSIPKMTLDPDESPTIIKYRLVNEDTKRKFKYALTHAQFNICPNDDAREVFSSFDKTFTELYDKHFPIKSKTLNHKDEKSPWITDILINRMKIRDKLYKAAFKKRISLDTYRSFRNKLTDQIRKAKANYYENEFKKNSANLRKTWSIINEILKPKKTNQTINLTEENGNKVCNENVSVKFVDYFTNIAENLTSQLPNTPTNPVDFLRNRNPNTFVFIPASDKEIEDVISDLKDNGAGVNKISNSVLKYVSKELTPILSKIVNICINQGYFPHELKKGCITPIFKTGNKNTISNYRPVCSLSPLSKIIEKVAYNKMIKFIDKYGILSKEQFGFRKNMGTDTALANYIESLLKGLNDKKYTVSIFMDLSKAFDVLNHKILKSKLEHYGFRNDFLQFIMSFVENRRYFVSANGHISHTKTVNIGVPQGSTLGPLLFLLYINDMINSSDILKFSLFADDSTATYSNYNLNTTLSILKNEFSKVLDWLTANKLIINLQKTQLMLFTNRKRPQSISLNVNGKTIHETTQAKFLGVILDNHLSWHAHIKHISNKISKSVAILRILRDIFPKKILKTLYLTLVYPYFNYCNLIWGSAYASSLKPLVILQKKCIRLICNADYLASTGPLFKSTNLMKLSQIYEFNCAKFMYNCFNLASYSNFKSIMIQNSQIHTYNTRRRGELRTPFERLELCRNSFIIKGIRLWNDIPIEIKRANSMLYFKSKIKKRILNCTFT